MKRCPNGCVTRQRNYMYKCTVCGEILVYMTKDEMKKSRASQQLETRDSKGVRSK